MSTSPPPRSRVIVRPDGTFETVEDTTTVPTPEALAELHRQTQDMIAGNTQFHTDPFAAPPEVPLVTYPTCSFCGVSRLDPCATMPVDICPRLGVFVIAL